MDNANPIKDNFIADVQGSPDARNIAIDKVGIKDIRHPLQVCQRDGQSQPTVAVVNMYVALPHHVKGTHMSRFIDILSEEPDPLSITTFKQLLVDMCKRLEAEQGYVEIRFPFFIKKAAPVSGVKSVVDYDVTLTGSISKGKTDIAINIVIPVTSLCPCSKAISDYGAHNQRSHIILSVRANAFVWLEELIEKVEQQASSEIYGSLKRSDEKFVTEKAYDNPKFVEDVVRDVASVFDQDERIETFTVSVENFESIHNHSAFAQISRDKRESV